MPFKFLDSTSTYRFNCHLKRLKVQNAKTYSVFIAFSKLETSNKNSY